MGSVWMMAANVSKFVREEQVHQVPKYNMKQVKKWTPISNRFESHQNHGKEIEHEHECKPCFEAPPGLITTKKTNIKVKNNKRKNIMINQGTVEKTEGAKKGENPKFIGTVGRAKPKLENHKCAIVFHATTAKKMLVSVERLAAAGK